MSTDRRSGWLFSLPGRLLAILLPLLALSMGAAILGLGEFLDGAFRRRAEQEAAQLGHAVKAALRQQMLRRPDSILGETLADLRQIPELRRIWVVDKNGRIAHATDTEDIGRIFDEHREPVCTVCHGNGAVPDSQSFFTVDEAGTPIVRHVDPIANERECWSCHDSEHRLTGILLLEESTESFQRMQGIIRRRLAVTGGLTLLVLVAATTLVANGVVARPIRSLLGGVRQLGRGDLSVRVPVGRRGEVAELAEAFNAMAEDLGRSLGEIRSKNAELTVVYSILERLTKTIDLEELKEIVLNTLLEVLGADQVALLSHLREAERGEVVIRRRDVARLERRFHDVGTPVPAAEGFPTAVAEQWLRGELTKPFLTPDRDLAVLPVEVRGDRLALLVLRGAQPFDPSAATPNLLAALAEHIGVAFDNARLYTLAITDELTRLSTVRHFHRRMEEEVSRHQRYGQKLALAMLDIDHFKGVNDRWGHPAGDRVLQEVARALDRSIRPQDNAFRYGGEEFAVLLPGADAAAARIVAERLREAVETLEIALDQGVTTRVTVSAGVAACPRDGSTVQQLVSTADAALYRAKASGRNRVCEVVPA